MTITMLSDLHLGLKRGNATKKSLTDFQDYQFETFAGILQDVTGHLMIVGDLFNSFAVDYVTLQRTAGILSNWLAVDRENELTLVKGNHDVSRNIEQMGAFDMLAWMLTTWFDGVEVIREPVYCWDEENGAHVHIIPHCINQEVFDAAIAEAAAHGGVLITHANYNNPFAGEKDHSLNLDPGQAKAFDFVISGHEHNPSHSGNVFMLGSPWPCNIQEAMVDHQYYTRSPGVDFAPHSEVLVWETSTGYAEVNWKEIDPASPLHTQFIRVTGEASAEEAGLVIEAADKLRSKSDAFIITNSVKVDGLSMESLEDAVDKIGVFDPMEELFKLLPEKAVAKIKEIKNEQRTGEA